MQTLFVKTASTIRVMTPYRSYGSGLTVNYRADSSDAANRWKRPKRVTHLVHVIGNPPDEQFSFPLVGSSQTLMPCVSVPRNLAANNKPDGCS